VIESNQISLFELLNILLIDLKNTLQFVAGMN